MRSHLSNLNQTTAQGLGQNRSPSPLGRGEPLHNLSSATPIPINTFARPGSKERLGGMFRPHHPSLGNENGGSVSPYGGSKFGLMNKHQQTPGLFQARKPAEGTFRTPVNSMLGSKLNRTDLHGRQTPPQWNSRIGA